jgi:hypothetical protein
VIGKALATCIAMARIFVCGTMIYCAFARLPPASPLVLFFFLIPYFALPLFLIPAPPPQFLCFLSSSASKVLLLVLLFPKAFSA